MDAHEHLCRRVIACVQRNKRMVLAFSLCLFMIGGVQQASASVFYKPGKPFFTAYTRKVEHIGEKVDPITVVFNGGGAYYDLATIRDAIHSDFHTNTGYPMEQYACNPDQYLWYQYYNGQGDHLYYSWHNDHFDQSTPDLTDLNMSDSPNCQEQNHTRIWDDYDYSREFGVAKNKWAVGTIHHEHRDSNGIHQKDRTFEQQASNLGYMLKTYGGWCDDKRWAPLPGSFSPKSSGVNYSDGWLTRLSVPGVACAAG
jgi:hypothetical protein